MANGYTMPWSAYFNCFNCCCRQKTETGSFQYEETGSHPKQFICEFFRHLWGMKRNLVCAALLIATGVVIDVSVGLFSLGTLSLPTAALTWVNYSVGADLIIRTISRSWKYAQGSPPSNF